MSKRDIAGHCWSARRRDYGHLSEHVEYRDKAGAALIARVLFMPHLWRITPQACAAATRFVRSFLYFCVDKKKTLFVPWLVKSSPLHLRAVCADGRGRGSSRRHRNRSARRPGPWRGHSQQTTLRCHHWSHLRISP
jgi:hypothetical protein